MSNLEERLAVYRNHEDECYSVKVSETWLALPPSFPSPFISPTPE